MKFATADSVTAAAGFGAVGDGGAAEIGSELAAPRTIFVQGVEDAALAAACLEEVADEPVLVFAAMGRLARARSGQRERERERERAAG